MVTIGLVCVMQEETKRVGFAQPEEQQAERESNCCPQYIVLERTDSS